MTTSAPAALNDEAELIVIAMKPVKSQQVASIGYDSWAVNPWVWAVEFRRIRP